MVGDKVCMSGNKLLVSWVMIIFLFVVATVK